MNKKNMIKTASIIVVLLLMINMLWGSRFKSFFNGEDNIVEDEWLGVITMWDFPKWPNENGNRFHWIEEKIKEFEQNNPGIFIELRKLNWEDGGYELEMALVEGVNPDIGPYFNIKRKFCNEKYIEDARQFLDEKTVNDYYNTALDAFIYDNKMLGFPFYMTTYIMYLNLDIFEERDVNPPDEGIWTWDEFVNIARKLTYDSNDDGEIDVYGVHSFIKKGYYNLWGILLSEGGEIFNEKNDYVFYDEKASKGLQKLVDLYSKYKVFHPDFLKAEPTEAWTSFIDDKNIGIFPEGSWAVKELHENYKSKNGFNFDVARFPLSESKITNIIHPGVGGYILFSQEDERKKIYVPSF